MNTCKLCKSSFVNSKYLNIKKIKEDPIRYLETCQDCRKIRNCENCKTQFKHHQNRTCSINCAKELTQKTLIQTQGAIHNFCKDSLSRQNFENRMVEMHGVSNVFQRSDVKESIKKTILSRYSVDNISKCEIIKNKKRKTLTKTLIDNPEILKNKWWIKHNEFINTLGYDPRLGIFGKASFESLKVFEPIVQFCKDQNILDLDIYIGIDEKSEFFISSNKKIYFYDLCIRSKKIIIEFHGVGFHANPNWDLAKLNKWRSAFTGETSKENIRKTALKNNSALRKGFNLLEIWSDVPPEENIKLCKKFIINNL